MLFFSLRMQLALDIVEFFMDLTGHFAGFFKLFVKQRPLILQRFNGRFQIDFRMLFVFSVHVCSFSFIAVSAVNVFGVV